MRNTLKHALSAASLATLLAAPAFATVVDVQFPFGQNINDNSAISSILTIPVAGNITSLQIQVAVSHTWVGDLIYTLSHGGITIRLMDRPGFSGSGFGDSSNLSDLVPLTFSDSASAAAETIGTGCGTLDIVGSSGSCLNSLFLPEDSLSAFTGIDIVGNWTLRISDNGAGDTGRLSNWRLTANIGNVPEPPTFALVGLALAGMAAVRRRML